MTKLDDWRDPPKEKPRLRMVKLPWGDVWECSDKKGAFVGINPLQAYNRWKHYTGSYRFGEARMRL